MSGRGARKKRKQQRARAQELSWVRSELAAAQAGAFGSLDDLERSALRGFGTLSASLLSKSESRTIRMKADPSLLPAYAWRTAHAVFVGDIVLERLGAPWFSEPDGPLETLWLTELRDGLDQFALTAWCLRFGYLTGGAAIARNQLERWTYNIASTYEIGPRSETEDYENYLSRAWSTYLSPAEARSVADHWQTLSELLHGRSVNHAGLKAHLALDASSFEYKAIASKIIRAAEYPLRQVRGAINTMARDHALPDDYTTLLQCRISSFPKVQPDKSVPDFISELGAPRTLRNVSSKNSDTYIEWGASYRRMVKARALETLWQEPLPTWLALEERWSRSIASARRSFSREKGQNEKYDPRVIQLRTHHYALITETCNSLASAASTPEHADALRCAAAALHSAFALWLQDSNDALACMRTALESTARARSHRLRPAKAMKLESRPAINNPSRWLETAGWRRLSTLMRAMSEFSHTTDRSRRPGAFQLLVDVQTTAVPEHEVYTARGSALDLTITLLTTELIEFAGGDFPGIKEALKDFSSIYDCDPTDQLEALLNHAFSYHQADFGPSVSETDMSRLRHDLSWEFSTEPSRIADND